jgi:hypothetical protein
MENSAIKANRFIHETGPYLLQHAYNPVDWYSWGETKPFKKQKPKINQFCSFVAIPPATGAWMLKTLLKING